MFAILPDPLTPKQWITPRVAQRQDGQHSDKPAQKASSYG